MKVEHMKMYTAEIQLYTNIYLYTLHIYNCTHTLRMYNYSLVLWV